MRHSFTFRVTLHARTPQDCDVANTQYIRQVKTADHSFGGCVVSGARTGKECVGDRELLWG